MNETQLSVEDLQQWKERIQKKIQYIKAAHKSGIENVQITVTGTDKKVHYFNQHDLPFNLQLEASILLLDSMEYFEDQITEIEYHIQLKKHESKVDHISGDF